MRSMDINQLLTKLHHYREKIDKILSMSLDQKLLLKLRRTVSKSIDEFELIVEKFWSRSLPLDSREKLLAASRSLLESLYMSIKMLFLKNIIGQEKVAKTVSILAQMGAFDLAISLMRETLWRSETFSNLAAIADIGYESGLIDESLKALNKLEDMGFKFFELYYNKALVLYMMGRDAKCLELLEKLEENYGFNKSLIGLKVAALIANNKIEEAKKLSLMRREKNGSSNGSRRGI